MKLTANKSMNEFITNDKLKLAFDFVQYTGKNIFLTGKAGTGKTTFLHQLKKISPKRMVVVAPTGVAAINAGGVTIHSFFQLPFGPILPVNHQSNSFGNEDNRASGSSVQRFNRDKISILKTLDLLVIDEISMVRADLLDGIDAVLKRYKDHNLPFGGVQLLMIGDLQQLAPVVKEDDWELLKPYYDTFFFFGSKALRQTDYVSIELTHIFRQRDEEFIRLLNKVRDSIIDQPTLDELNKRYNPNFVNKPGDGYITLTTHNYQAHDLNEAWLARLASKEFRFKAEITDDFPEYSYPTEFELILKKGAQVMFVKNDLTPEKQYYNGKIGTISHVDEDQIIVQCPGDEEEISVSKVVWVNSKYSIDEESKEITETIIGSFTQIPLKLAWAITIHKSQGLTFEKAIIDAQAAFAHGQVYVALSRCKTLEGMILSTPISNRSIKNDTQVSTFNREIKQNPPGSDLLEDSKFAYQRFLLYELFDFAPLFRRISYINKIIGEHDSILDISLKTPFKTLGAAFKPEFIDVAEKFKYQMNQLISEHNGIEENPALQDRVQKGGAYFSTKFEQSFFRILKEISVDTDNKTVRKHLNDQIEKLTEEITVKNACLKNSGKVGFKVKEYLSVRAKTTIEPTELKLQRKGAAFISEKKSGSKNELYGILNDWRESKANELNLEIFMILPQKSLSELAKIAPSTIAELKKIKGFGQKKVAAFGKEILKIIIDYRIQKDMEIPGREIPKVKEKFKEKKEVKPNTNMLSYNLFKSGKTITEIAAERNLAVTTIEGHLAHFVETGELGIDKFVDVDKQKVIADYFLRHNPGTLSEAKAGLGEDISFSELRYVQRYLIFNKLLSN